MGGLLLKAVECKGIIANQAAILVYFCGREGLGLSDNYLRLYINLWLRIHGAI